MNWLGTGTGWVVWEVTFRELEHFVRGLRGQPQANDPEHDLPEVEISDRERMEALRREVSRRQHLD